MSGIGIDRIKKILSHFKSKKSKKDEQLEAERTVFLENWRTAEAQAQALCRVVQEKSEKINVLILQKHRTEAKNERLLAQREKEIHVLQFGQTEKDDELGALKAQLARLQRPVVKDSELEAKNGEIRRLRCQLDVKNNEMQELQTLCGEKQSKIQTLYDQVDKLIGANASLRFSLGQAQQPFQEPQFSSPLPSENRAADRFSPARPRPRL